MNIVKATPDKIDSINVLIAKYGMLPITTDFINGNDIAIVAAEKGKVIGIVWAGLMANQKLAYIDYFLVDPEFAGKGVADKLGKQLVKVLDKKGVKVILAQIAQDQYGHKAVSDAKKIGLKVCPTPYVGVMGNIQEMKQQVGI